MAGILLLLECNGFAQEKTPNGGFASRATTLATSPLQPETTASISSMKLSPATVVGGNSSKLKVTLTQAAPAGGVLIKLSSADPAVVTSPVSLTIAKGHTAASADLATVAVSEATAVVLTASYNNATGGATLTVDPPKAAPFTVKLAPGSPEH